MDLSWQGPHDVEYLAFVRHRLTTNTVRGPRHWDIRTDVLEPLLLSVV